jgi:peptide/nickel transport system permease protein
MRVLINRIGFLVPVLLASTGVVFLLTRLVPGDPTTTLLGPSASESAREALRDQLALSEPLHVQYVKWLGALLHGDLGMSISLGSPVLGVVGEAFKNTLILGLASGLVGVVIGVATGIVCAIRRNSLLDRFVLVGSLFGLSMPAYWLSLVLIYVFAVKTGWFPTGQMHSLSGSGGLGDLLWHLVLPAVAAAVAPAAVISRVARAAMLEVISQDFLTALRAKGLSERRILYSHAVRNALPTIVTMSGLQIGYLLLGSALFVEMIFEWPGIGRATYDAVTARDFPLVSGVVLISTVVFVVINLFTDLLFTILSPPKD